MKPQAAEDTEGYLDPESDKLVGKRISVPRDLWNDILELAKASGANYQDVIAQLIDLGMRSQARGEDRPRRVFVTTGTPTRVELLDRRLLKEAVFQTVPAKGEIVNVLSKAYLIKQRAWSINAKGQPAAFLRVEEYRPVSGRLSVAGRG